MHLTERLADWLAGCSVACGIMVCELELMHLHVQCSPLYEVEMPLQENRCQDQQSPCKSVTSTGRWPQCSVPADLSAYPLVRMDSWTREIYEAIFFQFLLFQELQNRACGLHLLSLCSVSRCIHRPVCHWLYLMNRMLLLRHVLSYSHRVCRWHSVLISLIWVLNLYVRLSCCYWLWLSHSLREKLDEHANTYGVQTVQQVHQVLVLLVWASKAHHHSRDSHHNPITNIDNKK